MAKQGESALSRKIKNALRARGHYVWKNHGDRFSEPGVADLTGVRFGDGRFVAIETKLKTKLSKAQADFLSEIDSRSLGNACAGEAHSVDEAILLVETGDWLRAWHVDRNTFLARSGKTPAKLPDRLRQLPNGNGNCDLPGSSGV
jgi:hypothetical protein